MEEVEEELSSVSQVILPTLDGLENAGMIPSQIRFEFPANVDSLLAQTMPNNELEVPSTNTDVTTMDISNQSIKTKYPSELLNLNKINSLGDRVFNAILHNTIIKGYDETLKYGKKNKYLLDLHSECFNDDGMFN